MDWLGPLIRNLQNSKKNIALVVDLGSVVTHSALADAADNLGYSIVALDDYPSFRIQYESEYRNKWDRDESTEKLLILANENRSIIPYDIEFKSHVIEFNLDSIFKKLDIAVLEEVSPVFYPKAYDVEHSIQEQSGRLSKEQTIDSLCRFVWGFDPLAVTSIEMLISLMIDIFLSENKMPDVIADHIVNQYTKMIPDGVDFRSWFIDQNSFLGWLRSEWDKYLKNKLDLGEPGSIDFSHSILKIKSIQLMSESILPKIELPDDKTQILEKLSKEDSWLLLGLSEKKVTLKTTEVTNLHIFDENIQKDLEKLRSLSMIDVDSFLVKTRKLVESVVNDLYTSTQNPDTSLALYDKLKVLEAIRMLPRTTATFFHTLRILGNIGAHDTKRLELSQAEIQTILGLVTRVL